MRRPAALAAVLVTAACTIQTAGAPMGDHTLSATFDDVQSLVAGHSVQVSDVRIGTVIGVRLDGYRARVTMSLQRRIPEATTAAVAKTSILGENYVQLILPPGRDMATGPFLADGATITRTSVQPDIEQVTQAAGPLIGALSAQDVNAILEAASTAFAGKGEQLNQLIARTTAVTTSYAEARQDLGRTIDGLGRLGHDLAKGSQELDRLPGNLERATSRLAHGRRHIKKTILALTDLARASNRILLPRHAARLRTLLTRFDAVTTAMLRGKEDLKALVAELQRWIDAPPIGVNSQILVYIWLKGLIGPGDVGQPQEKATPRATGPGDFSLLLEPPL